MADEEGQFIIDNNNRIIRIWYTVLKYPNYFKTIIQKYWMFDKFVMESIFVLLVMVGVPMWLELRMFWK